MVVLLFAALAAVWMGLAVAVAAVMERRGFHPLPWFVVALLLGPAVWPLAVVEALSGGQGRRLLRAGLAGDGEVDVFVLLEKDEVPPTLSASLAEVAPRRRRFVLARVMKAGGPSVFESRAHAFLDRFAAEIGAGDARLELAFGDMASVATRAENDGFDVILRSDHVGDPLIRARPGPGSTCLRDERAA